MYVYAYMQSQPADAVYSLCRNTFPLLKTTTAMQAYITNIISSFTQTSRARHGWGGGGISRQGAMSTMYDITV